MSVDSPHPRVNPVLEVTVSLQPTPVKHVSLDDVRARCHQAAVDFRRRQAASGLAQPTLAARARLRRELLPHLGYYLPDGEATRIAVAIISDYLGALGAEETK